MTTSDLIKRYAFSTLVTFFAGFALVLAPALGDPELTLETFKAGALLGVFFSGARLGFKMVLELFLSWWTKRPVGEV